ncbi:CAZyme family GH5 [Paecilomyces variotii]|nr:CAZyme family GH5 [Paecilomyces variotii]KAJ9194663.1 CAZyme family GH5 [Paecilomyces variotii]KAJ9220837.1 CAZyme family GH5 [Paecilomyces variotii]KAJ9231299.1 CAZyme family GH5 [Paecilomyces variotii]KAJ9246747.1 CAZyme family GH5 [Paecilomyces variotii]
MLVLTKLYALSAFAGLTAAWLPGVHRDIYSIDGKNLFNRSVPFRGSSKRWLPLSGKIRGVNLGSLFVFEPWLAESEWSEMGCGNQKAEFDCVSTLGQDAANSAFQKHWGSWITKSDISQMQSYGLNTIRIPVGYWLYEDIVYTNSEHFPQGGLSYLEQVCSWASDAGLYIIIDLHGAPGAQVSDNSDTGQYASSAGFYVDYQYDRALQFLEWMTTNIHRNPAFRNVGMLQIVNEPEQDADAVSSMRTSYYPNAVNKIRLTELGLGIIPVDFLHIQMMDELWGSGDPNQCLIDRYFLAYDDHRYMKYDSSVKVSKDSYMNASCSDNRDSNTPTIVGEFSLSPPDDVQWDPEWSPDSNKDFYKRWFAAQVQAYEKQQGWIFWTWKAQAGDYRWSYSEAVNAGVIPTNLDDVYNEGVC